MTTNWTYDPNTVGTKMTPRVAAALQAGIEHFRSAAADDQTKEILVLVDNQVDFIHVDGALSVPGAVADTRRTIDFILRRTQQGRLTAIAASLDSHVPIQIFFPSWWEDQNGNEPAPYTLITVEDTERRRWRPRYEREWSKSYVRKLDSQAKKDLMVWPYHTMIGTMGHNVEPSLFEAIMYHSGARLSQPTFLTKGTIPKTENYSILEPEVKVADHPQGGLNTHFLDMLASYARIYVAGQAKSHCVLETARSIHRFFGSTRPEVLQNVVYLMDCMSSVAHPKIDFDAMANEAFAEFERDGAQLMLSTDVA